MSEISLGAEFRRSIRDLQLRAQRREVPLARLVARSVDIAQKIDPLQRRAERHALEFLITKTGNSSKIEGGMGWNLVRQYKAPGTGFFIDTDRIAPDTIIEIKNFYLDPDSHEWREDEFSPATCWISDEIDPHTKLPFIFFLYLYKNKKGNQYFPNAVLAPVNSPEDIRWIKNYFMCDVQGKNGVVATRRRELYVWKQGRPTLGRKQSRRGQRTIIGKLSPQPVPI